VHGEAGRKEEGRPSSWLPQRALEAELLSTAERSSVVEAILGLSRRTWASAVSSLSWRHA
jgi:hypothetical protein